MSDSMSMQNSSVQNIVDQNIPERDIPSPKNNSEIIHSSLPDQNLEREDFTHHHHLDLCVDRTPEGHEALIASLSSAVDPCERSFAATSLGYLDDPRVIPALEMAILTPGENIFVIEAALRSLSHYGDLGKFSANSVARLLNHESAIVRVAAVKTLVALEIEPELALEVIVPRLTDPSLGVRREIAGMLKDFNPENLAEALPRAIHLLEIGEGDPTLVKDLLLIIAKSGATVQDAATVTRDRLLDFDFEVRTQAIDTLSQLGLVSHLAGRELMLILGNPLEVATVRHKAALAIKEIGFFDDEILMDLARVIEEEILENNPIKIKERHQIKKVVIEIAGEYGIKGIKLAPSLRQSLKSGDPELILAAANSLARMGAFEILIDALNSTDTVVMQAITDAVRGIVYILKPHRRAKLVALLKLKLGWIKNQNLIDSILALLHDLEASEYLAARSDKIIDNKIEMREFTAIDESSLLESAPISDLPINRALSL